MSEAPDAPAESKGRDVAETDTAASPASAERASPPTIAVTGAGGYIGSRVLALLADSHPDWEIIALDDFSNAQVERVGEVGIREVDVADQGHLEDTLADATVVAHLAAMSGVDACEEAPDRAYTSNVVGTANVAWWCRKTGAGLIFPYSMAVLGDPETFPITAALPRDPLNWYGRTKLVGERTVETLAEGAFPAHLLLKSNLYGAHAVDGTTVSKGTVINFFVERALAGEPLTVYEPGTQARNFVHVEDVARAYVLSAEELVAQLGGGETGARHYEIASDEDPSVRAVAELVRDIAAEEAGIEADVELVANPRSGETLVEEFTVDTTGARTELGWEPARSIEATVRSRFREG